MYKFQIGDLIIYRKGAVGLYLVVRHSNFSVPDWLVVRDLRNDFKYEYDITADNMTLLTPELFIEYCEQRRYLLN